ncbi:ribonuclease H-like domain-containing protein, partial [Tanacetum coccineum]
VLVPRPSGANNVWCLWLFRHKFHADGSLSWYKAQLVANDSSQQIGIDFDDTFSLVVKPVTIRTVLSLALTKHWHVHHLDVNNAFLNGDLSETVYMHQPLGFVDPWYPHHVCHLQRSLYGLKQASRDWFHRFATYATRVGFSPRRCDSTLFIYTSGVSITRDTTWMFLSQKKYAMELLERAHMLNCNPTWTLADTESKLGPEGLLYLILLSPLSCSQQILHYVWGTFEFGLQLYASSGSSLVAYSDWIGCLTTRSGSCVFLGNNLLSWSSKRQHTLSRSSAKAEYRGVANVVAKTTWLGNLLRELHTPLVTATLVYCDNVIAVYLSANPVQHQRLKHIEIDIYFVRDMVSMGHVRVLHVPSRYYSLVIGKNIIGVRSAGAHYRHLSFNRGEKQNRGEHKEADEVEPPNRKRTSAERIARGYLKYRASTQQIGYLWNADGKSIIYRSQVGVKSVADSTEESQVAIHKINCQVF